jgi:hypothetical protein
MGNYDCTSGGSSSAPSKMQDLAAQPTQHSHFCRLGESGMSGQDTLDPKKPYTITCHVDHVIGTRGKGLKPAASCWVKLRVR